jgi:putative transposase
MIFIQDCIYHIYNQGNNKNRIFISHENYVFFVKKIRHHLLPYLDILAWCLMPNHFRIMVYVKDIVRSTENLDSGSQGDMTLNRSLGIMLASYTRAINIQEHRSGSLFRKETKAICLNEINGVSPNWFEPSGITSFNNYFDDREYPQVCFNYIHQNPVKAGLVTAPEKWEFSSYAEIIGLRTDKLISESRIEEFGLHAIPGAT